MCYTLLERSVSGSYFSLNNIDRLAFLILLCVPLPQMRTRHNYSYADLGDTLSKKKDAPQDHHSSLILESVYRSHSNLELCCRTLVCKWTSGWLPLYLLSMIPQFHQDHLRHMLITTWIKSNFFTMNVKKKK